jgi:hypothetical protein
MNHNRAQQVNANSSAIARYSSTRESRLAAGNVAGPSLVPMRSLRWKWQRRSTSASVQRPGDHEHRWPHCRVQRSEDQLCRNAPRQVRPRWAARLAANRGRESAQQIPKRVVTSSPAKGWVLFALRGATGDANSHNRPHNEESGTSPILRIGGAGEFAHFRAALNLRPGEKIALQAFCAQSSLYRAGQSWPARRIAPPLSDSPVLAPLCFSCQRSPITPQAH